MNFICFDTEDDSYELRSRGKSGFDKKVTQIAALTAVKGCREKKFYNEGNVPEFLEWILKQKQQFIYAHNLQYDLGNLFGHELDSLDVTMVGGRMIRARWKNKIFLDSFNIWPMSAKKLGKAFGLEKLETQSMATDVDYVFRDVEIIRDAMRFAWKFARREGIENLPPTLGGLCVKLWKEWGGENVHDSTKISKDALYGGRVELFKTHSESNHVFYVDLNSLYPSVMRNKFPASLENTGKHFKKYGVAEVTIKIPKAEIMVLPWRDDEGKVYYPWGTIRGCWTILEINEAVNSGAQILEVHNSFSTDRAITCYKDFVETVYGSRKKSRTEAEKLFYKLVMNNLYGRLGASGEIARTVYQTPLNRHMGIPYGEKVLVKYKMPLAKETNWIHAAYVTAYGRLELLKYLRMIGAENLIYCDTDSAIFDWPEGHLLPFDTGNELGQMKIEYRCSICGEGWHSEPPCKKAVPLNFWSNVQTYAPKMYIADGMYKAKGVPKKYQREYIEQGSAVFDLPFRFREAAAFFDRDNEKRLSVWREVEKINHAKYEKKVLKGNRFFPCKKFQINKDSENSTANKSLVELVTTTE